MNVLTTLCSGSTGRRACRVFLPDNPRRNPAPTFMAQAKHSPGIPIARLESQTLAVVTKKSVNKDIGRCMSADRFCGCKQAISFLTVEHLVASRSCVGLKASAEWTQGFISPFPTLQRIDGPFRQAKRYCKGLNNYQYCGPRDTSNIPQW